MTKHVDFQSLTRPRSPNTYLLAPAGLCGAATPDGEAPVFDMPISSLFRAVKGVVSARRDWTSVMIDDEASQISFVPVSRLMRFKDDVSVKVLPVAGDAAKSTLAIYSASRVGYSDMGANAKRVGALLDRLADGQNA